MSAYGEFLLGLVDNPKAVSAPTPSGSILAARIAAEVTPSLEGLVVELGPGTGAITRALLDRGVAGHRILAIENSAYFCDILRTRFPVVTTVCGDAFHFERYLPEAMPIAAVVCGLPLLNFPADCRRALIERALDRQGAEGRFIQLSYGWRPAVPAGPDLAIHKTVVWRNFPPAHIWTYRRKAMADSCGD